MRARGRLGRVVHDPRQVAGLGHDRGVRAQLGRRGGDDLARRPARPAASASGTRCCRRRRRRRAAPRAPEALAQREQVGQRLAGMVQRRERVHHRHRGVLGQLLEHRVLADPARRSRRRSATAPARCPAPTRRGRAAAPRCAAAAPCPPSCEMPTWNETRVRVEGFSNSSATLRSRSGRGPRRARGLQLDGALDQRSELGARKLGAGDEVARVAHGGILGGRSGGAGRRAERAEAREPAAGSDRSCRTGGSRSATPGRRCACCRGTCSTGATPRPIPRCARCARGCCARRAHNDTHVQVNRSLREEFAGDRSRRRLGRLPAPGVPAPVGRPARRAMPGGAPTARSPRATGSRRCGA